MSAIQNATATSTKELPTARANAFFFIHSFSLKYSAYLESLLMILRVLTKPNVLILSVFFSFPKK